MIKINLAARKRSAVAQGSSGGSGMNLSLDLNSLSGTLSQLKELPIKKLGLALVVAVLATITVNGYMDDQLKAQNVELEKLQAEKPRLQAAANKMRDLETLQKSMESDEQIIRTKLDTIQKLTVGRGTAMQTLEEISKITPDQVWIKHFEFKDGTVTLGGYSLDFSKISDFTRNLENSTMFSNTVLKDTQTTQDEQKRDVASFSITTNRRSGT